MYAAFCVRGMLLVLYLICYYCVPIQVVPSPVIASDLSVLYLQLKAVKLICVIFLNYILLLLYGS